MRRKNVLWVSLLILIIFSSITMRTVATPDGTEVWVDPPYYEAPTIGHTFSVTVKIRNVTGLFGYEIKLWYNTTILNATSATLPTGHFLTPVDPSKIFIAKQVVKDDYNATHGYAWVAVTLLAPENPKTGDGTLFKVDFKSTAMGLTPLTLLSPPAGKNASEYPVKLSDINANAMPCKANPGSVKVIPEFPVALLPLFMIITLISVILGKTWLKKRRISFDTN